MSELYQANSDKIAQVNYHLPPVGVGEDYNFEDDQGFYGVFEIGYQSTTMIDRTVFPAEWDNIYEDACVEAFNVDYLDQVFQFHLQNAWRPTLVDIEHSYDEKTQEVNIDVTATFIEDESGDMRIYVVLIEEEVSSDLPGYEQNQWYEVEPFVFERVAKYMPGGFFGVKGTISSSVSDGDTFVENFNFVLPTYGTDHYQDLLPLEPEEMSIIASVVKFGGPGERPVLNTLRVPLISKTVQEPTLLPMSISTKVDKENSILTVEVSAPETVEYATVLYDYRGLVKASSPKRRFPAGKSNTRLNINGLEPGTHFLKITTNEKDYTKRVIF